MAKAYSPACTTAVKTGKPYFPNEACTGCKNGNYKDECIDCEGIAKNGEEKFDELVLYLENAFELKAGQNENEVDCCDKTELAYIESLLMIVDKIKKGECVRGI